MRLLWPRPETPTHWVVMGLNPDLDDAMKIAVRETIDLITKLISHARRPTSLRAWLSTIMSHKPWTGPKAFME
jgi:acetamidase/formamidase